MNNKGQAILLKGVLILIALLLLIVSFTFIEPLKEALDNARSGTSLNCKGTSTFNQTSYDAQSTLEKLTYRPTCAVTGFALVYLLLSVIIAVFVMIGKPGGGK